MRLVYHPSAEREIIDTARFYDERLEGLGNDFLDQIDAAAVLLQHDAHRFPVIEHDIRRIMLKRFPFGIYYRITDDTLRVLAVKHHRQHPGYGLGRR